jgi:hypothetical protein
LDFICFPFSFTDLQVHQPALADLLSSQFTRNWREIHPNFLLGLFHSGARVFLPIGRACAFLFNSASAHAPNAPLSTQEAMHLNQNLHCKALDVWKIIFPA